MKKEKSFRCYVNFPGADKTKNGKRKVWRTNNIVTYCCSSVPTLFVWEKSTKYNNYEPYKGYFQVKYVELIAQGE